MRNFNTFLTEGNTHIAHIEERLLSDPFSVMSLLGSAWRTLGGHARTKTNISLKIDGAPAFFFGKDPEDGQFFISTKGLFNKTPKFFKSVKEIQDNTKAGLAEKLTSLFNVLKKVDTGTVIYQADFLFDEKEKKLQNIEGVEYVTFHPNTIMYAVPTASPFGSKILRSKVGFAIHTAYKGNALNRDSLKTTSFNVDGISSKLPRSAWNCPIEIDSYAGQLTFTAQETKKLRKKLLKLKEEIKVLKRIHLPLIGQGDRASFQRYTNDVVRKSPNFKLSMAGYKKFLDANKMRSDFDPAETTAIQYLMKVYTLTVEIKQIFIDKYNEIDHLKGFLVQSSGDIVATNPEGFVISDTDGNLHKLVDRMTFSRANFNNDRFG